MSTFFFHLRLELYSSPAASKKPAHPSSKSPVFVPHQGSDIFKTAFPAHRIAGTTSDYDFDSKPLHPLKPSSSRERLELHGDAVLLPERSPNLRQNTSSRGSPTTKPTNESAAKDWRYDTVEIESIDMVSKAKSSSTNGLRTKGIYVPSDPKATDVGWGVVHLYRDADESTVSDGQTKSRKQRDGDFDPEDCTTVCMPAVPSWMTTSDVLGFVGDQTRADVSHFRLIRTGRENKYMVLMKFRSPRKAREWRKANNSRLYSITQPETCHVVLIKSVEFLSPESDTDSSANNFPHNTNDPFTRVDPDRSSQGFSGRPLAPPPPNLLELPTCPVCLERMDETTGLLTSFCQHVFHCDCLEKWRGSGCPVCRYTQSPSYTFPYPRPSNDGSGADVGDIEPSCSICATTSNLWICLICGNLGCGRYDSAHAYAHYESTSHCYAMNISTQHIWDYAGDGYVHRLIQSKPTPTSIGTTGNNNFVDLPTRVRHENEAFHVEAGDSVPRDKMENMAAEYTYLLTSQLEGQRRYFEEQVERAVDKAAKASSRADEAITALSSVQSSLESTLATNTELSTTLERLQKALEKSEQARTKAEQLARTMTASLKEEKIMADGLVQKLRAADQAAEKAKEEEEKWKVEKAGLEEMNHDLTMFISGQKKVEELAAEGVDVADSDIVVQNPPESAKKGRGKGKGRKK